MTAPKLENWKFWIVKPLAATNQIKNPAFALPDGKEDWAAQGAGVTIADTTTYQRRGSNAMQVNPATNVASGAYHPGLTVVSGFAYTFSCDVKGVTGQAMRIYIADVAGTVKATKTFTANGYWQRYEIAHTAAESVATYRAYVIRDAVASTAAYYVDGAQFEQASKASTFIEGDAGNGYSWTGLPRNSSSTRSALTRAGGELICINDYAKVISTQGFGMGQFNQITTKMSSGGDLYQGSIRKSRDVSLVLAYDGDNQGDMQASRKVILDAVRPDLLEGQEMILRYQGFDISGVEATNPVDIVCAFKPSHISTPSQAVYQKDVLQFTVSSGLFDGAYNEGSILLAEANFPAEFIVKRDPTGNWCDGASPAASLITGLNGLVDCLAEGPDGKIYAGGNFTDAGGVADADYLARWNPITNLWEAVVAGINSIVNCMAFDANGDLYIGGAFTDLGSANGDHIVKITDLNGTPTVNALGTGLASFSCYQIVVAPDGSIYAGGAFASAGGVANTAKIAKWNGITWSALATGLNSSVNTLAFAPNSDLYIGGMFTNADGTYGDYLCYWNGTAFVRVGTVELSVDGYVNSIVFDNSGHLIIGGEFVNAGGNANADYIAKWNGSSWEALGTGVNNKVYRIYTTIDKLYVSGVFTNAGGLTLTDRLAVWFNGAWQAVDVDLPGTGIIYSVLPTSDNSLYVGGIFSTVGETPDVNAFCSYTSPTPVASASANTYPVIEIVGPGVLKGISNYSTGANIQFDGLTLLAGEWLTLKLDPTDLHFTSSWSGRGSVLRYVIPGSDYGAFYLKPGANNVSLFMNGTTAASSAIIRWSPKFWGIDGALL